VPGEDFSVDIKPDRMELRSVGLSRARLVDIHTAAQGSRLSRAFRWRYERTRGRLWMTRDELLARLAGLRQA
jgi:hypothetical protein